jgi:hypothetical protein
LRDPADDILVEDAHLGREPADLLGHSAAAT